MQIESVHKRIQELRRYEADTLAQLHAVQGAIAELEQFWVPVLQGEQPVGDDALSEQQLETLVEGKIERKG